MRLDRLLLLLLAAPALLPAHPDHNATQRGVFPTVPATEAPPGTSEVAIIVEGNRRIITANGLPDHPTGKFPNADNPNRITAQRYRYTMPAQPVAAAQPAPLGPNPFGIALNGVLFDPGTAEMWHNDRSSGWHYDANGGGFSLGLDANQAHVQPNGAYHYHGVPAALLARLSAGLPRMTLIGWAADGFPIYGVWGYRDPQDPASGVVKLKSGYRLKSGPRPTAGDQPGGTHDGVFVEDFHYQAEVGDLDDCSGRFGVTPEFPAGTFYYVLTEDFPFIPRAFRGTPDPSFRRQDPADPVTGVVLRPAVARRPRGIRPAVTPVATVCGLRFGPPSIQVVGWSTVIPSSLLFPSSWRCCRSAPKPSRWERTAPFQAASLPR